MSDIVEKVSFKLLDNITADIEIIKFEGNRDLIALETTIIDFEKSADLNYFLV